MQMWNSGFNMFSKSALFHRGFLSLVPKPMSPTTPVLSSWCLWDSCQALGKAQGTHFQNPPKCQAKRYYNWVFPKFHFLTKVFPQLKESWGLGHKCTFNWCGNFWVQIRSFHWRVNKKIIKATIRASGPEKVPFPSFSFFQEIKGSVIEGEAWKCGQFLLSFCLPVSDNCHFGVSHPLIKQPLEIRILGQILAVFLLHTFSGTMCMPLSYKSH